MTSVPGRAEECAESLNHSAKPVALTHASAAALAKTGRPVLSNVGAAMPRTKPRHGAASLSVSGARKSLGAPALKSRYITSKLRLCSTLDLGTHLYPGSIWHASEQPSPGTLLPSSHVSGATASPSPQLPVQPCPLLVLQSGSTRQLMSQPSKGTVLLSSHVSVPSITPSPHTVSRHTLGSPVHM